MFCLIFLKHKSSYECDKCSEVNEASLMLRAPGENSQMYRVPSFGDDPFDDDDDDQVCQKRKLEAQFIFGS